MGWYKVQFAKDDVHNGKYLRLYKDFLRISIWLDQPDALTLFSSPLCPPINDYFCYCFPSGSEISMRMLIRAYDGVPCDRSPKDQIELLDGPEIAWDIYFPNH